MVWNNRLLAHCTGKHIFEFGKKSKWNTKKIRRNLHIHQKHDTTKKHNNTGTNGAKNQ